MIDFQWDDIEAINETQPEIALLAAIGAIADMWATFELTIDGNSIKLANLSQDPALCLTSQISGHGRKLDALISIAKLTHTNLDVKAINKLAEEAGALARKRNRVVHDPWHATKDGLKKQLEISAAKTFTFGSKQTELKELRDLYTKIWDAREKLIEILERATPVSTS